MGSTRTHFRGFRVTVCTDGPNPAVLCCAVLCCALQVPGSLTSSMVDDVFFILKKSSSRALATQVGGASSLLALAASNTRAYLLCHDNLQPVCVVCPPGATCCWRVRQPW